MNAGAIEMKVDTKIEYETLDFGQALIERLYVTLGFAPKREKRPIERMIKWLSDGEPPKRQSERNKIRL